VLGDSIPECGTAPLLMLDIAGTEFAPSVFCMLLEGIDITEMISMIIITRCAALDLKMAMCRSRRMQQINN
jgi:hypothetical protein